MLAAAGVVKVAPGRMLDCRVHAFDPWRTPPLGRGHAHLVLPMLEAVSCTRLHISVRLLLSGAASASGEASTSLRLIEAT